MSKIAPAFIGYLLLMFTTSTAVWADAPHLAMYSDDHAGNGEPEARDGPALRFGTLAGYSMFVGEQVGTLGGYVAAAFLLGPFAVEGDYGHMALYAPDPDPEHQGNIEVGRVNRLGVTGRVELGGPGRNFVGPNSKLVFWLEGGAGVQLISWANGETFRRYDQIAGLGLLLDHRFKRPLGFPSRVGWHFGWRFTRAGEPPVEPKSYMARVLCKAQQCSEGQRQPGIGLLVSSGLHFSW